MGRGRRSKQGWPSQQKTRRLRTGSAIRLADLLLLWVRRSLGIISERRELSVGGQLISELGFCREVLFLAGKDLGSRARAAAKHCADSCAFAAAHQGTQQCANCRAAAHVHSGALVRAQSAGCAAAAGAGCVNQVRRAVYGYGAQIKVGIFAVVGRNGDQASARSARDHNVAGGVFYVLTHAGGIARVSRWFRGNGGVCSYFDLSARRQILLCIGAERGQACKERGE